MRLLPTAVLAASMASAATTATAQGMPPGSEAQNALALLQRIAAHYSVLTARSFVDLTYDQLTIEPGTNHMIVSGLKIYPILDWDTEGKCEISIDRLTTGSLYSFETLGSNIDVSGVSLPAACLDPGVAGMMSGFGYDEAVVDAASIDITYSLPDSAASVAILASVKDAADISVTAEFDYLWVNLPLDGYGDPLPVAQLGHAEVAIENKGLWERLEPMAAAQMGDLNAIPQMAQMMVGQAFTEGGSRTPTDGEQAFVANLSAELARFLEQKNRFVITSAPLGGVWLDESIFDSPQNMVQALQPKISATPSAYRAIVPPSEMKAAMAEGAQLDDATRMRIGKALITGVGAPLSISDGGDLLEPLARNWNGEAALLLAEAAEKIGQPEIGYEFAMIALASGEVGALGVADTLEQSLSMEQIISIQESVGDDKNMPGYAELEAKIGEAMANGDVGYIRKVANATSSGIGSPRHYYASYALATLAAAGGDRSAANLRDRMDRRFGDDPTWQAKSAEAATEALRIWTDGGLGDAISAKVQ